MARYPFRHRVREFLAEYRHVYARSTYAERVRALTRMQKDIELLFGDKKISTADPAKMTFIDVKEFFVLLKDRGLGPKSISHELSYLKSLCSFYGNPAVDTARNRFPMMKAYTARKRKPTIPYEVIDTIISLGMKKTNFDTMRDYAVVVISICAGLRADEIRNALRDNLDLEEGTIYVDIVKGRGTYGEPRTIPIVPQGLPLLTEYVKLRDAAVPGGFYLFPSRTHSGPLATNTLRKDKDIVAREADYEINFQSCRRTYGQWLTDDGVPADTVSLHMGHKNSKTTENYYARKRESDALSVTKGIWAMKGGK